MTIHTATTVPSNHPVSTQPRHGLSGLFEELIQLSSLHGEAGQFDALEDFLGVVVDNMRHLTHADEAFILYLGDVPQMRATVGAHGHSAMQRLLQDIWDRRRPGGLQEGPFELGQFFDDVKRSLSDEAARQALPRPLFVNIADRDVTVGLLGFLGAAPSLSSELSLGLLSCGVSAAIENFRTYCEARRHLTRQSFLRETDRIFSSNKCLSEKLRAFLARIHLLRGVDACSIVLRDAYVESDSARAFHVTPSVEPMVVSLMPMVATRTVPVYFEDLSQVLVGELPFGCYLGIPLSVRDTVIGVLHLFSRQGGRYDRNDIEFFFSLAEHIALNIDDAFLLEQSQQQMEKRAREEASSRAKSEFLAVMSHELRSPLTVIIGFAELLMDVEQNALNDRQKEYVDYIVRNSNHLLELVNDVLDLAKVEAGRRDLVLDDFDLTELMGEIMRAFSPLADRKGVSLEMSVHEQAPVALHADRRCVRQILYNLVSNAVKFTDPNGSVRISCAPATHVSTNNVARPCVRFEIADSGIGVQPQDLDRIFEPFKRGSRPAGRHYEGTGLGLSLSRKLVELSGGTIGLTSRPGVGSTFFVLLPVNNQPPHDMNAAAETVPASRTGENGEGTA